MKAYNLLNFRHTLLKGVAFFVLILLIVPYMGLNMNPLTLETPQDFGRGDSVTNEKDLAYQNNGQSITQDSLDIQINNPNDGDFDSSEEYVRQGAHLGNLEAPEIDEPKVPFTINIYYIINNEVTEKIENQLSTMLKSSYHFSTHSPLFRKGDIQPHFVWVFNRISHEAVVERCIAIIRQKNHQYTNEFVVDEFDMRTYMAIPLGFQAVEAYDPLRNKKVRRGDKKFRRQMLNVVYSAKTKYFTGGVNIRNLLSQHISNNDSEYVLIVPPYLEFTSVLWQEIFTTLNDHIQEDNFQRLKIPVSGSRSYCNSNYMPRTCHSISIFKKNVGPNWTNDCNGCDGVVQLEKVLAKFPAQTPASTAMMAVQRSIYRQLGRSTGFNSDVLISYNETVLNAEKQLYQESITRNENNELVELIKKLLIEGDRGKLQKPYSVVNKTEMPPSHNIHDYYSVKPYYWPDPTKKSGLPYIRRDGQRIPGSTLYDSKSHKFDRTSLADMMRNTTLLALSWFFTDDLSYAEAGARNIRTWFLDPQTRMNPHCSSAQILWLKGPSIGASTGVIEFQNFHYLLDGVRLLKRSQALSDTEYENMKLWIYEFARYLDHSRQGKSENYSDNNHGLYFDVQRASHAAFVNDTGKFTEIMYQAYGRLNGHFTSAGVMPREMARPIQLHYMMFTLQGWLILAMLGDNVNANLWRYHGKKSKDPFLLKAVQFNLPYFVQGWTHKQTTTEDMNRAIPMYYQAIEHFPELRNTFYDNGLNNMKSMYTAPPLLHETDGTQIFWNLGLSLDYGVKTIKKDFEISSSKTTIENNGSVSQQETKIPIDNEIESELKNEVFLHS